MSTCSPSTRPVARAISCGTRTARLLPQVPTVMLVTTASVIRRYAGIFHRRGPPGAKTKGADLAIRAPWHFRSCVQPLVELALDLLDGEALDHVADLDVLEAGEHHAAFLADGDFVDLVLEALERLQGAQFQDHDVLTDDPDLGALADHAFGDLTAGDLADLADVEGLQNLGVAKEGFALDRGQHAREHAFDVVQQVVDDRVVADLDPFALGQGSRLGRGPDVEADDRRAGALGQHDVAFADRAGARQDDPRADLVGGHLVQRTDDRLGRTLHVGLDDQRQFFQLLVLQLGHNVGHGSAGAHRGQRLLALQADAVLGQLAGAGLVLDHGERVARRGHAVQAEDLDRGGGTRFLELFVALVEQRADLAPLAAGHDDVAALQRAA